MPNRYICDVLDEMRETYKTYNFSVFPGLIEECQSLANRMEAALYDKAEIRDLAKELRDLKQQKRELELSVEEKTLMLKELSIQIRAEKLKRKSEKQKEADDRISD